LRWAVCRSDDVGPEERVALEELVFMKNGFKEEIGGITPWHSNVFVRFIS